MSKQTLAQKFQDELLEILVAFERTLPDKDIRKKVLALVPAFKKLRDLGKSLIPKQFEASARDRILTYFQLYPGKLLSGDEILVVSGIQEYARRIRELRVEYGWKILSGNALRTLSDDLFCNQVSHIPTDIDFRCAQPDSYVLVDENQDRDAAFRWNLAKTIRNSGGSSKKRILDFFLKNVGKQVSGEELQYVAGDNTEWARRVRELRTEHGWNISSKASGRPDLPVGVYVLESARQLPEHDRTISDSVRAAVLERDGFACRECGWQYSMRNPADRRSALELHHVKPHVQGGKNEVDNLVTLCNVCHDQKHARHKG